MTSEQKLKAARAKVNAEAFGTEAWEAAMQDVRSLVEEINSQTVAKEPYHSIDGDIFEPARRDDDLLAALEG